MKKKRKEEEEEEEEGGVFWSICKLHQLINDVTLINWVEGPIFK